jgi:ABC-2 type transport system ATP-binding protein
MSHSLDERAFDSAESANAVSTRGLTKRYGTETALDGVDLRVPEGAVYVLIGANGAGKSTTIKLLLNLERADSGVAEVFGLDTRLAGPKVRAQIGYVPERHDAGYAWMTCGRLLDHVAAYYPAWDHRYADRLISALDVRRDKKIGSLSKGDTRRVQLVMALAHRPALLLLDEPTDGLDPVIRKRVLTLLTEHLADSPTTVLITTHHIHEVESLADHVGILRAGRLVIQVPRDELQRTVARYWIELPDGWVAPPGLVIADPRGGRPPREVRWTIVGDEREVSERLTTSGARVREVSSLSLEEAALALLPGEGSR